MGEIQNEKSKKPNYAWRKKPRKFAPKSRLGCKTCKIRRVKCDLSEPSCLKCRKTGRTCDGYGEPPFAFKADIGSSCHLSNEANREADSCNGYHPCTTVSEYQPNQWQHAWYHGPILQNLGPFMILPATGTAQAEAMSFFEYMSIKDLNEYHPCESWRKTLMFFSQTVPSVRHAATALALIHRNYQGRQSTNRPPDNTPLVHYNRAIQLLLNQENSDSTETTAVTLLVCYLFTCFDHLAGNYVQAMKHLRGGVELSRNINNAILNKKNSVYDEAGPSGACMLASQVTRQIRRLDLQAATFLLDWIPAAIQDSPMSQLPPSDGAFESFEEAADHLQILLARVMTLRNTEQQMTDESTMPPSSPSVKDVIRGQLETWSSLFENLLQQGRSHETDPETHPIISRLRLHHTILGALISTSGPGGEMAYDSFLPEFQQCVALAGDVAAAHVRYSGSLKPTFTPELGILPVLYIMGAKCRDPAVRREVLRILRRQPIQEAVWDSAVVARVVERIVEIEEGGSVEGKRALSMEQIAAWQRIETVSWVQTAARVDLTYTFCGREGVHTESLVV